MKRFALLLICTLLLTACAGTKLVRTPVVKDFNLNLTLEQVQEKGQTVAQNFQHPYQIEEGPLRRMLTDLTYVADDEKEKTPIFQGVEIDRMAGPLAEILAQADASQRIRFLSYNKKKGLLLSNTRKSEGVMFVDGEGKLNIAFNCINIDRYVNETTAVNPTFDKIDPLSIPEAETRITSLPSYARLHQFEDNQLAPMWIAVDLQQLQAAYDTTPVTAPNAAQATTESGAAAGAAATGGNFQDLQMENIRGKLNYLKQLVEEGLITEDDYNAKKLDLLDRL
jgi:hypothetical protein